MWSFVPPGSRGHIDFGEQFPYDPEKARALLREAGYNARDPLRYTIMTHSAEASLPTIATISKQPGWTGREGNLAACAGRMARSSDLCP
jgi:ABC-type transport system substrate-binding protein